MPTTTTAEPSVQVGVRRAGVVGLLYLALTIALLVPFSLHLGTRAMSPGSDWNFTLWVFAWDVHSFLHQPWHIFDANIMAPLPNTLGYEENAIGSALMVAPVIWITHNVNLAANLAALLTIPLSGLGVYVLARKLRVSEAGAVLAGLVFALDPPRFFRLEQFHVTAIQWVPFCLAWLHDYLDHGRRRDLWVALAFFSAQAVTSGHGTAFLLVAILSLLAYRALFGEPVAAWRRLRDFGVAGVLLLTPALLIFLPYHRAQAEAGLSRTLLGWYTAPASFLATPSRIDSALVTLYPLWLQDSANAYLFPGYLVLLFLAVAPFFGRPAPTAPARDRWLRRGAVTLDVVAAGYAAAAVGFAWFGIHRLTAGDLVILTVHHLWRLWVIAGLAVVLRLGLSKWVAFTVRPGTWWPGLTRWRQANRQNAVLFYGLLALVGCALLVGPPFGLWQFVYWIPPLSFIRAPLRFSILVVLGLAVLTGFALDRTTTRLSPRGRALVASVLGVLFVIEFSAIPIAGSEATMDVPSIDRWLNTLPKPFTIAEVPIASPGDVSLFNAQSARYMVHSTAHFQKTVMGFTGVLPQDHADLFDELSRFPDEASLRHLAALHVTYVVVHGED
ncbi:MAG TPA: hypothetical protein VIX35_09880, partial [Vicinamibacterales bacterium]